MLEREIKKDQIYRHFKGHIYRIVGIAKDSETLEEKVIYENMDTNELWIRDKVEFLSLVDKDKYPNVEQKYRFELLKED